jgi:hypothetical protein
MLDSQTVNRYLYRYQLYHLYLIYYIIYYVLLVLLLLLNIKIEHFRWLVCHVSLPPPSYLFSDSNRLTNTHV